MNNSTMRKLVKTRIETFLFKINTSNELVRQLNNNRILKIICTLATSVCLLILLVSLFSFPCIYSTIV